MESFRYDGVSCPICNKEFKESDDIVVCPDCGTPYHRDCYQQNGECLFKDKHSQNYEFKFPEKSKNETVTCPVCHKEVSKTAKFCENCGAPLNFNQKQTTSKSNNQHFQQVFQQSQQPFDGNVNFILDPLGGIPKDENFDGATTKDITDYVQVNTPYYMRVFKQIKDTKTSRFNFTAFLFSGGWFLFRKQYKIGIVITLIMFLLLISSIFIQYVYAMPIVAQLVSSVGLDIDSALYSMNNIQKLIEPISQMTALDKFIMSAPTIIFFIELIIMIFCGIKANAIYMKNCIRCIKSLNEKKVDIMEKKKLLNSKGGINKGIAISLLVSYVLIKNFLPYIFI